MTSFSQPCLQHVLEYSLLLTGVTTGGEIPKCNTFDIVLWTILSVPPISLRLSPSSGNFRHLWKIHHQRWKVQLGKERMVLHAAERGALDLDTVAHENVLVDRRITVFRQIATHIGRCSQRGKIRWRRPRCSRVGDCWYSGTWGQ
jgi:hypothetical protein